jgi:O-antigen/teichoic acid export membrane protein
VQQLPSTEPRPETRKELARRFVRQASASSGIRASALMLAGIVAANAGAFIYSIVCTRWLGADRFGEVAALTALATMILLPFLSLQTAVAREVARLQAQGRQDDQHRLLHRLLRRAGLLQVALSGLLLALTPVIARALSVPSDRTVIAGGLAAAFAVVLPVLMGFQQGLGRFRSLSAATAAQGALRPFAAVPLILVASTAGALLAGVVAAAVAVLISTGALRDVFRRTVVDAPAPRLEGFGEVFVGLLAFTSLTNVDVLVAKGSLSSRQAGAYAAAAVIGKVATYIPFAVTTVLLPRVAERLHRGEDVSRMFGISLAGVAVFGVAAAGLLALVPESLVQDALGRSFGDARDLMAPFALVMTLCSLANVSLTFAFAARERSFIRIMVGVALLHLALLSVLHDSPRQILTATAIAAFVGVAAHEAVSRASVTRSLLGRPARA